MINLVSTSVKFHRDLYTKILLKIINEGYGMRGKTKWILESIERFLTLPNFVEFVDIADEAGNLEEVISLRIPKQLNDKLEDALILVRQIYPKMEGVKSKIIRASIMQRLIRG